MASMADNFCGKTRTCANFNEPNAKSRELASSNPSGITVTADAVIVRKIVTASCPVNRYATRIIPATTTAPYVSHVIARWINRCNGVSSGEYRFSVLLIAPAFVSSPVAVTRANASPAVTTVAANSASSVRFSTATDSPVSILSLTSSPLLSSTTASAGNSSPGNSRIRSPTASALYSTSVTVPSSLIKRA